MSNISNSTVLLATINPIAAIYNHYSSSTSKFANVPQVSEPVQSTSVGGIIVIIIIVLLLIVIMYYSCKAVYNLTDSVSQVIMYFIFGVFYLYFAMLYYGLSGYKYKLSNSSSNSNSRY